MDISQFILLFLFSCLAAGQGATTSKTSCGRLKGAFYCDPNGAICITSEPNGKDSVTIRIAAFSKGWIGFGVGSDMKNSDMIVGWINSRKQVIISDRWADSYDQPKTKSTPISQLSTDLYSGFDGKTLCVTINRKLTGSKGNQDKEISNKTLDFIWAWSNSPPTNIDDSKSMLSSHGENHGTFKANLLKTNSTGNQIKASGKSGYSSSPIYLIHGILMVIAWYLLALFGSLTARLGRTIYGTKWFPIHVFLMILVILITIVSTALIIWKAKANFTSPHNIIGLVITITAFIQGVLGYVIHILYDPDRDGVPWYDWIHRIIGYVLVPLGMVNCILGIIKFKNNLIVWICISAALVILVLLYFFISYQRASKEEDGGTYGSSSSRAYGAGAAISTSNAYEMRRPDYSNQNYGNQMSAQVTPADNVTFFDKVKGWFGMGGGVAAGTTHPANNNGGGSARNDNYNATYDPNVNFYDDNNETDWTYGSRKGAAYKYYDDSYYSNDSRDDRYRQTKSRMTRNGARTSNNGRNQGRENYFDDRY